MVAYRSVNRILVSSIVDRIYFAINGISEILYVTSLMRKMGFAFLILFIASIPLWWFFEGVNRIVRNWEYILPYPVSGLHYFF